MAWCVPIEKEREKKMPNMISTRALNLKPSATISVAQKARELKAQGKDIISLSAGEPDFDTPDVAKQAGIAAINANHTHYPPIDGIPELKKAIIAKFKRDNNLTYNNKQILVTVGCKQAIFNLILATINPGDEVIIPVPYWVSYSDIVELADGKNVFITADIKQDFKITATQLKAAITPKTKMIMLNSPCNPTGAMYNLAELKALAAVLVEHENIIIATDDIYEHLNWSGEQFYNIVNAEPKLMERTVVLNGVSKAYAMTGWRIGFAAGPESIIGAMNKIQSQSTSGACTIAQYAAAAALTCDLSIVQPIVAAMHERHDLVCSALNAIDGINCAPAQTAMYCFPEVSAVIKKLGLTDDVAFAEYLLDHAEIAVVPGTAFGMPGYIRISIATNTQQLKVAMQRLAKCVNGSNN
jgi:aspartate aminotransferase